LHDVESEREIRDRLAGQAFSKMVLSRLDPFHYQETSSMIRTHRQENLMTVLGKRLSEYVAYSWPFLGLILIVGIARLALPPGGMPHSTAKWLSVTAVMWIGVLYYLIRVPTGSFGSYQHLLPICVLQSPVARAVIVPAIILAIFTGHDNIYTAPEYSFGQDGKTWFHAGAHLLIGTTVGPLISWLVGCVIMFATKKLVIRQSHTRAAARG
jgi:hypothetical protein